MVSSYLNKYSPIIFIVLFSLFIRALVYFLSDFNNIDGGYFKHSYYDALDEHFWEYFYSTTVQSPLVTIIDAVLINMFSYGIILKYKVLLLFSFLLDVAAISLIYLIISRFSNSHFSVFFTCLMSVSLIPFEFWRLGGHYDHYSLFFSSFFLFSLLNSVMDETKFSVYMLTLSSILLSLLFPINIVIVPLCLVLLSLFKIINSDAPSHLINISLIPIVSVILVIASFGAKNYSLTKDFNHSSKSGAAMMQVVSRSFSHDPVKLREFIVKSNVSKMFVWCFDNPTYTESDLMYLARHWGMCFQIKENNNGDGETYSVDDMVDMANNIGSKDQISSLLYDQYITNEKPYLLSGYAPEYSFRWTAVWGAEVRDLYLLALKENPLGMVTIIAKQAAVYSVYGPFFPYEVLWRSEDSHWSELKILSKFSLASIKIPFQGFIGLWVIIFGCLVFISHLLMLVKLSTYAFKIIFSKSLNISKYDLFLLILGTVIFLNLIVYSTLVGGEHYRYFMHSLVYVFVGGVLVFYEFRRKINKLSLDE